MQLEQITLDHLKRWTLSTLAGILAAAALAWLGDFTFAHLRGPSAVSSLQVERFMVTPLKGGKAEYDYLGQDDVPCTRSLFPQLGNDPCWYVQQHKSHMDMN